MDSAITAEIPSELSGGQGCPKEALGLPSAYEIYHVFEVNDINSVVIMYI